MAIRVAKYFYTMTRNRPGYAAHFLGALKAEKVNLLAFSGFPNGRQAQLDFVPADPRKFLSAAKKAKIRLSRPKLCFLLEGSDKPGAVAAVIAKLAKAKINLTAFDAARAGGGRFGAIFWVKPKDVSRAARVLGARR